MLFVFCLFIHRYLHTHFSLALIIIGEISKSYILLRENTWLPDVPQVLSRFWSIKYIFS